MATSIVLGWLRHEVHVDQLEPKAGDPLEDAVQGALVWQVSMECRDAMADDDLAVVELRAQGSAGRTDKGDLVCS